MLMSIAGIEKVREAETKAAQIKKSSEEAAAQIIADGKKESKILLEDADRRGNEVYKTTITSAEVKAEALYQEKIDAETAACEQLKTTARENLSQAASAIVGKVVGTYGND
nr:hypothetical protein [uncultured Mogibacterium sp.]